MILRATYNYTCLDFGGDHNVPVVMKLDKGKQLQLWPRGRTIPQPYARLCSFPSTGHALKAVAIGHEDPPVQRIVLQNPSQIDVEYEIDTTPLQVWRTQILVPVLRYTRGYRKKMDVRVG